MIRLLSAWLVIAGVSPLAGAAQQPAPADDVRRQAAMEEFTRKTREANYPEKFEAAAREFNVPADVLKGIAFAGTRWEHLIWPPGETAWPPTSMPRPYGIMSLWDNDYFGHSLVEAARLIGKDPEELKRDPLQNIRGAAALLRKLHDELERPAGTSDAEVEAWRYAIRKFCGIPQPDLAAKHALDIYTYITSGYHQHGIEWDARPVDLEPIRQETEQIVAQERQKRSAMAATGSNAPPAVEIPQLSAGTASKSELESRRIALPAAGTNAVANSEKKAAPPIENVTFFIIGGMIAVLVIVGIAGRRVKQ